MKSGENSDEERSEQIPLTGNELNHTWRLTGVADLEMMSSQWTDGSGVFFRSVSVGM